MVDREGSLRIAMVSHYLPSGSKIGVGHQADALARALVARGHRVDVISDCPASPHLPYGVLQIKLEGSLQTFRFAAALRRVNFKDYDVIHAHGDDYWLWRRRAKVHIRTMHGSCFEEAAHIRGSKERIRMLTLGFSEILASIVADRTVVVSPATRRWTPWAREVIPNGVDLKRFHPDESARSTAPIILFVGTWGGRKRGRDLAAAFSRHVKPRIPNAQLWMVTRDAPAELPDGIVAFGRVTDDKLAKLYRQAWLFCLPSSYEGFGIPYIEAMASGTPVIATPNIGSKFVLGTDAGILTPLDDLGPEIVRVLRDDELRRRLAVNGVRRAGEFSLDHVASAYERLYRMILEHRRSRLLGSLEKGAASQ